MPSTAPMTIYAGKKKKPKPTTTAIGRYAKKKKGKKK